jgi:hypothetical protein
VSDQWLSWAAAAPKGPRRLHCSGHIAHHFDGSPTCSEGVDCPGVGARHDSAEWHRPDGDTRPWSGCWCVSGDLSARLPDEQP